MASSPSTVSDGFNQLRFQRESMINNRNLTRSSRPLIINDSSWHREESEPGNRRGSYSTINEVRESINENQNTYPDGSCIEEEEEERMEKVLMHVDAPFNPEYFGLKEIGNHASWTVSSFKPGCGVDALRDEETSLFWQSDGPQPHYLNIHFSRLVSIVLIRMFLDFDADESYTPTRITLLAGTGYHDLIIFNSLTFEQPRGWINIPLDQAGGGEDGKTLRAFLLQIKITENHQNGKDTHVRGLKIYAQDEREKDAIGNIRPSMKTLKNMVNGNSTERGWLIEPDWIEDPQLR
ncbi:hypothetical protein Golomagni_03739 [Golovinomyces magnicellulatus]|nr:hypothetical protein Golomagni_03739 [Golovinomyces magnicellulatus]